MITFNIVYNYNSLQCHNKIRLGTILVDYLIVKYNVAVQFKQMGIPVQQKM